jgi:predicted NBD/HSP70 family sugar kinase
MAEKNLLLGVDLGGSKIEAALIDGSGAVVAKERCITPAGDYAQVLGAVVDLCVRLESNAGIATPLPIGIGTPGSPSPQSGLMRNCNSTALNGRALRSDLQNLSGRAVRLANDGDCFALSEATDGAAAGLHSVFGVILGTGVGGGICIDGQLLQGPNAVSGEWGHNRIPLERVPGLPAQLLAPRLCYCGRENCIETWLCGAGLALTHERLHRETIRVGELHRGEPDTCHSQTLDVYAQLLAAALGGVINILDPDAIVFGGGLSNIHGIFERLPAYLALQIFSDMSATRIYAAKHGDSSGVRGAAWLWADTGQPTG